MSSRLRGGFRATTLPGVTISRNALSSNTPVPERSSTSSHDNSFINVESNEDLVGVLNTILNISRTIQEQLMAVERRIGALEGQQVKVNDAVKELNSLLKQ